jgi:hypothetical protein
VGDPPLGPGAQWSPAPGRIPYPANAVEIERVCTSKRRDANPQRAQDYRFDGLTHFSCRLRPRLLPNQHMHGIRLSDRSQAKMARKMSGHNSL